MKRDDKTTVVRGKVMITETQIARIVGALFLITMIVGMFDAYLVAPTLTTSLSIINENQLKLTIGAFLILTMALGITGIAIVLFPLVKKYSEVIAVGYVSFRIVECILLLVGTLVYLFLISLSNSYVQADMPENSQYLVLFKLSVEMRYMCYQLAMTTLGIGSIFLCYLFYKTKLLSAFLSIWGLVGYVLLTLSGILDILGIIDTVNGTGILLYIPGGLWEFIVFPAWLLVRGFNVQDVNGQYDNQAVLG